ncbi:hypothetical protein ECG_08974 [Echinococcus granulosus]|uniref:Expressed conserved protein n=1 Tax=Echinococcus granulosus TaxID=6210 RepID=A0A068WNR2_ECHGR|nr:hypothetical protein ECG_08974 [Echinococcus granulosus]CDS21421.1 hypothetical protein EgrG_000183300 [Echinococcus granulosus]
MNAFYFRSESVELSQDDTSEYSYGSSEVVGSFRGPLKSPSMNASSAKNWGQLITHDQVRDNNFWIQPPPSERFEVIPMLCRVKCVSPRHTQSENGVPLASQRPPRGNRFPTTSSSSAPPRVPARPRALTSVDGRLERCRQLERTVRNQEKIITLLENELQRRRPRETRKQTPLRGRMPLSTPMGGESAPSLPCDSGGNSSVSSSMDASHLRFLSSPSQPPQSQPPLLPLGAPADPSSVPVLARRVRSLVRDIREETEASLLRRRERLQDPHEQYK